MSFSDYAEGKVLDHVFNKAPFTQPTLYLAISTANPTDVGSPVTAEPSGNGYLRVAASSSSWARTGNVMENDAELAFPEATGSWGTLTHFALYDASSGGNMIIHGALTTAKAIAANETLRFPAGNLTFTLD